MRKEIAQLLADKLDKFAESEPIGGAHKVYPSDEGAWERIIFDAYKEANPTVKAKIVKSGGSRINLAPRPCFYVVDQNGTEHLSQNCLPQPVYMWAGMAGFDPNIEGTYISTNAKTMNMPLTIRTNISEFSKLAPYGGLASIIRTAFL